MADIADDKLGAILPSECDDELLASGLPGSQDGNISGAAAFGGASGLQDLGALGSGQAEEFAFEVNSGEFPSAGVGDAAGVNDALDADVMDGLPLDLDDPEFMKRQLEEMKRYEKLQESSAERNKKRDEDQE